MVQENAQTEKESDKMREVKASESLNMFLNERFETDHASALMALIMAFILGAIFGCWTWRLEAVKKGHAEYNQVSGIWQWKAMKGEK